MPLIDRRSPLTANNARASDVAAHLTEHVVPIQQQKMMAAFRVQGIQAILYSGLTQGTRCTCHAENKEVSLLSPDGKASPGAINRVLTGQSFGVSDYNEEFDEFGDSSSEFDKWLETSNTQANHGSPNSIEDDGAADQPDDFDFDLGSIGFSDVSCPICFGTGFVGGYSPFRGFRKVIVPSELSTASVLNLPKFELSPGTHEITLVLPARASYVDVFRAMLNDRPVPADFFFDNTPLKSKSPLQFCDGRPHTLKIVTSSAITHVEIQFAISNEPIYFEIPRLTKSSDISLLEQQEPFQIIVSPDVPLLNTLDVISESQLGKHLIVQTCNPWNTRNRQMLGHEIMVRVAQPQELYNILPVRSKVTGAKTTNAARPAKAKALSGVAPTKSFTF